MKKSTTNLPAIYSKLLWKSIGADPGQIEIGASVFDPVVARIDEPRGVSQAIDAAVYGLVAEMSSSRFLSLANGGHFEEPTWSRTLSLPTIHLFTDDERTSVSVDQVGGVRDVLRFREENGIELPVPVVVFIENNQQAVPGKDVGEALLRKIERGIFPRNCHGRAGTFVQGRSFSGIHVQSGTSEDYEAYDLSPDQWADAMQKHVDEHFGPLQLVEFVAVGKPGW